MKCLIFKAIEIKSVHSFEPCVEVIVPGLIYARLYDSVLGCHIDILSPQWNLNTIVMGSVYPERLMRSLNSSI
jgi:hypothetical protein